MSINRIETKPTIYGAVIDTCLRHDLPYEPLPYWTINDRYQIHNQTVVPNTAKLKVGWYAAGIGGTNTVKSTGGLEKRESNPVRVQDAGLYKPLPFIVRPINNDLTAPERANYGMRAKIVGVGNIEYWAYYLRPMTLTSVMPVIKKNTIDNGNSTITDFIAASENNAPIVPTIPVGQAISTNGIYYTPSFFLDLSMSDSEFFEYQNAAELIYGDAGYGYVSEIGIVAGYKSTVPLLNASLVPISGTYDEILRATIINRITLDVGTSSSAFQLVLDSAAALPEYGITSTTPP